MELFPPGPSGVPRMFYTWVAGQVQAEVTSGNKRLRVLTEIQ